MRLLWKKHRMGCPNRECGVKSFTLTDHRISAKGARLTTRAAKWATRQVGTGRSVKEVAKELKCDWGVINKAVMLYGEALLAADRRRLGTTEALGLDETLFVRKGKHKVRSWCTTVADVGNAQLIDILATRDYKEVAGWVKSQPHHFKERIAYGALDLSNTYAAVFSVTLPKAIQVADRFHVMRLANLALDTVRRRVQNEVLGHRGRRDDPLYRSRKLLVMSASRLDDPTAKRLESLLALGDPGGEVALAHGVKEAIADFYGIASYEEACEHLDKIIDTISGNSIPEELRKLGRTLRRWFAKICAYHLAKVTNGPTEGLNNLIKRVKRVAFGFSNFENYRIRVLLYAGKPNWRVLDSIVVS